MTVAKLLDCDTSSSKAMVDCLRTKPYDAVVKTVPNFSVLIDAMPCTPFGPVVEKGGNNPFITETPYQIISKGKIVSDVPWVTTNVAQEGLFVTLCEYYSIKKSWNHIKFLQFNGDSRGSTNLTKLIYTRFFKRPYSLFYYFTPDLLPKNILSVQGDELSVGVCYGHTM